MARKWTHEGLDREQPTPEEALAVTERIKANPRQSHPTLQGAVLAELLSIWIAGHVADTSANSAKLRREMLKMHVEQVRKLIPVNAKIIHGKPQ